MPAGLPLVSLKASGFGLKATVADAVRYRLVKLTGQATAQIENGPGPFPCPVLGGPEPDGAGVGVTCGVPVGLRLFEGLPGIVAVRVGVSKDTLALPVEAVAGSADEGMVSLQSGPTSYVDRSVKLGISDGSFIEVLDGLSLGDVVRVPAPSLIADHEK